MADNDNAYKNFSIALKISKNFGLPYYARAVVNKIEKRNQEAISDFEKYLEIDGNKDGLAREVQRLINEIQTTTEED